MPQVYQAADGRWIVFNNGIKSDYFTLESEAIDMSEKIKFASEVQSFNNALTDLLEEIPKFQSVWGHREYLAGADGKAITDADLDSLGITAAQLAAFITPFCNQMINFLDNSPITQGDHRAILSALRTDI